MKSRITVEIDYNNNNQPVIQILSRNSDDVRDGLIKSFYQALQGSSWCKIRFVQDEPDESSFAGTIEGFKRIFITPIPEDDLKKEAEIMLEQYRLNTAFRALNSESAGKSYEVPK
jgi:hypothetical protein